MHFVTDAALETMVLAAARGDRDAFARLVDATSGLVSAIALAETRDADLARDAAQDVYLQVWSGLGQLRRPESFLPWLRLSARRQARRLALQRRRRAGGAEAEAALAAAADGAPGPGERLLDAERAALVRDALEALPDEARETLVLYYREGHSTAQVARLLGLSDAAVQQRLSRARARVREDVLRRLGEALERSAPAAGFTAAVLALLGPKGAAAATGAGSAAGGLVLLQVSKVAAAALAVGLAAVAWLATRPPVKPPAGPPTPTIARPAGERPAREQPWRTAPAAAQAEAEQGALEVVVTAGGAPVPGAAVRVYAHRPEAGLVSDSPWRLLRAAATDAGGRLRMPAGPGAYLVAARAPGLAAGQLPAVRASGEPLTRVEVALTAGAALPGRTVDARGQPVPLAALVLARSAGRGEPRDAPPAEERLYAVSDGAGTFRVEGLAPGRWTVTAEAAGHARTVVEDVGLPRAAPLTVVLGAAAVVEGVVLAADGSPAAGAQVYFGGGPELVQVEAGPAGGFAAELVPGAWRVSALRGDAAGWLESPISVGPGGAARGLVIRLGAASRFAGMVVGPGGTPVAGALVELTPARSSGAVARPTTGPDGAFETGPLPPGEYDVAASAEGLAPWVGRGLVLMPGQRFALTVKLAATAAVEGLVTGGDGAPLPGVRIRGGQRWGSSFGQVDGQAVTGLDGRYRIDGLEPGMVRLMAMPPGADTGLARLVPARAGETVRADFVLTAPGEVDGQVTVEDGSPLPEGLQVQVAPPGSFFSRDLPQLTPGPDGRFSARLPVGTWQLDAWDDAMAYRTRPGLRLEVVAGATVRADLVLRRVHRNGTALGLLVLEPGGAPSRGAMVEGRAPPGAMIRTRTGDDGRAEAFIVGEGGRRLPMEVTARNGGRRAGPIPVPAEQEALTIQLQPGATLRGRVEGGGAPVSGFDLRIELPLRPPASFGDAEGRSFSGDAFLLTDVPADAVTLVATAEDGRVGRATATLRPGETTEVTIPLAAAGRLRVRVLDQAGKVEPGAYLTLGARMIDADPSGFNYDPALLHDGALEVPDLAAGKVSIEVGARCFEPVRREVEIRPGETTDLGDVRLTPVPREKCGR